ncbi:MAG: DUF4838 domain-containing protein [candidate division Zixibacteria bacterium]|nr:DUF4838 domain-containing protein [candidate division Zixibacteria bacterium]
MKRFLTILILLGGLVFSDAVEGIGAPDSLYLVKAGYSFYDIYLPPDASEMTSANVDTLRRYLREVAGIDLPVTGKLRGERQIVVEIGESRDHRFITEDLSNDGFVISTEPGNKKLFLTAHTDYGFQNAVYTFIESYLGCRRFSPTIMVVPKRPDIVLQKIFDRQVPVITSRMQDIKDPSYMAWHKLNNRDDFGLFVHTFDKLVPPEKYFDDHPEYFSMLKGVRTSHGQLCLANPDVFRIVVEELRTLMQAKPSATFWSVSQNDTYVPCECDACREIDSVEGSSSGSILSFVNRIADEFPDMTISTLAYQYSRAAPKNIRPRPNVNIMLCSIECNRSRPLAEDPASIAFVRDVENWSRLTNNIFLWDYVIQFRNLVSPFPNLHVLQPNLQFFVRNGISTVFEQGLPNFYGEFAELRIYLLAKLLWNPDINVDSVMNDFLQGFYGGAAPHIRRYIDTMHAALQASGEGLDPFGYPVRSENGYLSPDMMDVYEEIMDRAEEAVRDDTAYLGRVRTAWLPVQFALLEQAKASANGKRGCFSRNEDGTLKVRPEMDSLLEVFVRRCKEAGIPRLWEHGITPDEYYLSTRTFFDESTKDHLARNKAVILSRPASPKYHQGEAAALTDGLRGWNDYHTHWLGFEGEDMEAAIDLGSPQTVTGIKTTFLQDINSWVFMPLAVMFFLSVDGEHFRPVGEAANAIPVERDGVVIAPFDITFTPTTARYVRVRAVNMKTCPAWHKGSGGPAWIFIDEIIVQ